MKVTAKQANVLDNLHRIVTGMKGGKPTPFLDGEACRSQINSLAAKGLIALDKRGRATKVAHPEGIIGTRWQRSGLAAAP